MECIKHILLILVSFLPFSTLAALAGQSSCHCLDDCLIYDIYISGDMKNQLYGLCGYDALPTTLDLNLCFGNTNGKLAWQDKSAELPFSQTAVTRRLMFSNGVFIGAAACPPATALAE